MFNIFKRETTALSNKQKYLLNELDSWLVDNLMPATKDSTLQVLHFTIPTIHTALSAESIISRMTANLPKTGQYVPRTIAFVQEGLDWHIFVGVRQLEGTVDHDKNFMFFELVNQTNEARSK